MDNRVIVTGYGIVSCLGIGKEKNKENLFSNKCGIKQAVFNYKDKNIKSASGLITDEVSQIIDSEDSVDRIMALSELAIDEAVKQSNIFDESNVRIGIVVGTSLGGMLSADKFHSAWLDKGIQNADPKLLTQYPLHAVSDYIAKRFKLNGPKLTISTACSSGANAVGLGYDLIKSNLCDVVIAGGVDPLSRFSFAGFTSLKAISNKICRPYSKSEGINLGEGAAFFVLEKEDLALRRKQSILAEIRGYGLSADAYHETAPDASGNGAYRSMSMALEDSELSKNEIDYINGHGTGTQSNDIAERKSWKLFTKDGKNIPLISNKSSIAHCLGAAGALELAYSLMSLEENIIPPTLHFEESEEKDEIDFVPNISRAEQINSVLSNSFAFGGNNCSVILSKYYANKNKKIKKDIDVVITGIGCIGVGGNNIEELYNTFSLGKCMYNKVDTSNFDFTCPYIGDFSEPNYRKYIPYNKLRRMDDVTKMAIASATQALKDSQLKILPSNSHRIGVIYGTGTGPSETIKKISESIIKEGISGVNPDIFPNSVLNSAPGQFSILHKIKGVTSTLASGNTSGLNAVIYACELIKSGKADAIIVISSDEWDESLQVGNEKLKLLSKDGKPPFSENSDGYILSKGSVALVLENKEKALSNNKEIYAEIRGYSLVSDNSDLSTFNDMSDNMWKKGFEYAREISGNNKIDYYASTSLGIKESDQKELELMNNSLDTTTLVRSIPEIIGTPSGSIGMYALLSCIYSLEKNVIPEKTHRDFPMIKEFEELIQRTKGKELSINCAATSVASFGGAYTSIILQKEK